MTAPHSVLGFVTQVFHAAVFHASAGQSEKFQNRMNKEYRMKRKIFLLLTLTLALVPINGQTTNFSDSAAVYFHELQNNASRYKYLWNVDLYGPVLLVDPATRKIFANYSDSAGVIKEDGLIFTGTFCGNLSNIKFDIRISYIFE